MALQPVPHLLVFVGRIVVYKSGAVPAPAASPSRSLTQLMTVTINGGPSKSSYGRQDNEANRIALDGGPCAECDRCSCPDGHPAREFTTDERIHSSRS